MEETTNKLGKRKLAAIIVAVIVAGMALAAAGYTLWDRDDYYDGSYSTQDAPDPGPKPEGSTADSFIYNSIGYSCSRKIDGSWSYIKGTMESGWRFKPDNHEDFKKYCRGTFAIEYRAVIDILKRPDVDQIIAKYDTAHAWVRALSHDYIEDKEYLARILPDYHPQHIDCIIIVHSPEGTRYFIEMGEEHHSHDDHQYQEVPAAEFLASLNAASDEDVTNFWLGLR